MTMTRLTLILAAFLFSLPLFAGRSPGFSMSVFNTAVPASSRNAVFSPFSFEIDSVLISEAFGPIEKASYVEALGALVGYDSVYKPICERYAAAATNDFRLVSARAFLASSLRLVAPKYRSFIQTEYGAQACPVQPSADGAESFLRVAMDGAMEDFRVPAEALIPHGISFCDLESFRCCWAEPFPAANTRRFAFTDALGRRSEFEMMTDLRNVDIWKTERFSLLRMPMADEAFFFVVLPEKGVPLDSVRGDFAAAKFDEALVVFRAVADPDVYHGSAAVVIPKFAIDTVVDLAPTFRAAGLPTGGFKEIFIGTDVPLTTIRQRTRFVLDERGPGDRLVERKSADEETRADKGTRRFVCDRPFLFFVYHEPTRTVPVSGIFAGGES